MPWRIGRAACEWVSERAKDSGRCVPAWCFCSALPASFCPSIRRDLTLARRSSHHLRPLTLCTLYHHHRDLLLPRHSFSRTAGFRSFPHARLRPVSVCNATTTTSGLPTALCDRPTPFLDFQPHHCIPALQPDHLASRARHDPASTSPVGLETSPRRRLIRGGGDSRPPTSTKHRSLRSMNQA